MLALTDHFGVEYQVLSLLCLLYSICYLMFFRHKAELICVTKHTSEVLWTVVSLMHTSVKKIWLIPCHLVVILKKGQKYEILHCRPNIAVFSDIRALCHMPESWGSKHRKKTNYIFQQMLVWCGSMFIVHNECCTLYSLIGVLCV